MHEIVQKEESEMEDKIFERIAYLEARVSKMEEIISERIKVESGGEGELTLEQVRKMSAEQINQHWEQVSKLLQKGGKK